MNLLMMSRNIETNPGPVGLQLSELHVVMDELNDVRTKWYDIGLHLGVGVDQLDCIKRQYSNSDFSDCLRDTLKVWLETDHFPTWRNIVDALRSNTVSKMRLARDLECKYCSSQNFGLHFPVTNYLPPPVAAMHPPQAYTWAVVLHQTHTLSTQQPAITSLYSGAPQPQPSCLPPRTAPYYLTVNPSTPFLTPLTSGVGATSAPSTVHLPYSQISNVTSTTSRPYPPTPMYAQAQHLYSAVTTASQCSLSQLLPPSSFSCTWSTPRTEVSTQHGTVATPSQHAYKAPLNKELIKQHVNQLQTRFRDLVFCSYKMLLYQKIDVDLRCFRCSLLALDVFQKEQHQEFINEHLMKIDPATTFDDLWAKLSKYWNFLNFDLLEHIVSMFGDENLKTTMEIYKRDLQYFREVTRLCDFISCWPVRGQTPPEIELREFVAKMNHDWDNCTLENLDTLKGVITRKFFLPKFALRLQEIKEGCIAITWLIPAPFAKGLQKAVESTSSEFFKEQMIETITIDGQYCYPSPTRTSVGYPKEQVTSQSMPESQQPKETPVGILTEKLPSFKLEGKVFPEKLPLFKLEEKLFPEKLPSFKLEEKVFPAKLPSFKSEEKRFPEKLTSFKSEHKVLPPEKIKLDKHSGETLQPDTLPLKKKHSNLSPPSKHQEMLFTTETPLVEMYYKDVISEDLPLDEKYAREKYVDESSMPIKLLSPVEQFLSKDEVEVDPFFPAKYKDYLSSTPSIKAALYTNFNAKMSAEVFAWSQHTESVLPTTMTELYTAFTLKTLVQHVSAEPLHHKQQMNITTFSDLPADVYTQFQDLCKMAYEGILNENQLVFSVSQLPSDFAPLGLMQEMLTGDKPSSYRFIHWSLQEYVAAIHIVQLPVHVQAGLLQKHLHTGHFKLIVRFLTAITRLANIPPEITRGLMKSDISYFHLLFEAKDISLAARLLSSDVMVVKSHFSWTPLDYYVTGYAISHSNCPWRLKFSTSCIDNEKFELFCQGCAAHERTGCRSLILDADLSGNYITFKIVQSFVTLTPHILQNIRDLELYHSKLDGDACNLLAKVVPSMYKLEKLWLSGNPIGSGGAVKMIKALCCSRVKVLWLANTGIEWPDCHALCELLKSSRSLQQLNIYENNLSSESVACIMNGLNHNSSLSLLNISNSHFSMENVDSLALILRDQSNSALTSLVLRDCQISGKGENELAYALCKNSTLKYLDLNHNSVGIEGAFSMSSMLHHNTSLEYLYLCDDSIGEEGSCQLINGLKHNETLKELRLSEKLKSETTDQRIYWKS